jgi:anti-anti-sigma factor
MQIHVNTRSADGCVRVVLSGDVVGVLFDDDSANPLAQELGAGWRDHKVLMDFDAVTHVDSSGVGWLLYCNKALAGGGGDLVLFCLSDEVKSILRVLRVDRVLKVAKDQTAAEAMLDCNGGHGSND